MMLPLNIWGNLKAIESPVALILELLTNPQCDFILCICDEDIVMARRAKLFWPVVLI